MTMGGSETWTPPVEVFGPLPYAQIPAQPTFRAYCVAWEAFDVPRMWDMLAGEADLRAGDDPAWVQARGFAQLSQLLVYHHGRLKDQHTQLSAAWNSPAGQEVLSHVEALAESLLSDAHCAQETAFGLDRILTGFAEAKVKVADLRMRWDQVTTDWWPEWWDDAAERLNNEARDVMVELDETVKTNRHRILIPRSADPTRYGPTTPSSGDDTSGSGATRSSPIPPVPGHDPIGDSGVTEAELAGLGNTPSLVPAVPGAPVSMLPIPPGNQFAPFGGAYILPGPGVGRAGYVVPMPSTNSGRLGGPGVPMPGRGGGAGMMPMPMGVPMPGSGHGGGAGSGYRRPVTAWSAEQGVPPVIDGVAGDAVIPDRPNERQETAFKDWFAELAYPWRSEDGSPQPQVTFRKVAE